MRKLIGGAVAVSSDGSPTASEDSLIAEVRRLSEEFIVHFYQHDWPWCSKLCHPDVSYLGSTSQGIALSLNQLQDLIIAALSGFNPSLVLSLELMPRLLSPSKDVLVIAQFHLVSDPTKRHVHALRRRGTLIWTPTNQGLRVRHMHFSIPYTVQGELDGLADISNETYLYARTMVEQMVRRSSIALKDVSGTLHYISPLEVNYLEADRQRCIIHCIDRNITVRRGLQEMVELFGDELVLVHRSFAVNPSNLRMVMRDAIIMNDGSRIPLPQRRAKEVRDHLEEVLKTLQKPQLIDPELADFEKPGDGGGHSH